MKVNLVMAFLSFYSWDMAFGENSLTYVPSNDTKLGQNISLIGDCWKEVPGFERCTFYESKVTADGTFFIEPVFHGSPQTRIKILREFQKTGGDFKLVINGVEQPIPDGKGEIAFTIPSSTTGKYNITIQSIYAGQQDVETGTIAKISSITLVKDNTAYVNSVLQSLGKLVSAVSMQQWTAPLRLDTFHQRLSTG